MGLTPKTDVASRRVEFTFFYIYDVKYPECDVNSTSVSVSRRVASHHVALKHKCDVKSNANHVALHVLHLQLTDIARIRLGFIFSKQDSSINL